jgi:CHASE3 domain sensor protein
MKLLHKALLLIAVPLLFQLCFVSILVISLRQLEQEYKREATARNVLICVNSVLSDIIDCAGAVGMLQVNHEAQYIDEFRKGVKDLRINRQRLQQIANSNQRAELARFNTISDEVIASFQELDSIISGNNSLDMLRGTVRIQRLLKKVNESGMNIIREEEVIDARGHDEQQRLRDNLQKVIITGVGLNILLAIYLALLFNRTTVKRLNVLSGNTLKLIPPPIKLDTL